MKDVTKAKVRTGTTIAAGAIMTAVGISAVTLTVLDAAQGKTSLSPKEVLCATAGGACAGAGICTIIHGVKSAKTLKALENDGD